MAKFIEKLVKSELVELKETLIKLIANTKKDIKIVDKRIDELENLKNTKEKLSENFGFMCNKCGFDYNIKPKKCENCHGVIFFEYWKVKWKVK